MTDSNDQGGDPWGWVDEAESESTIDLSANPVTAVLVGSTDDPWVHRTRAALEQSTVPLAEIAITDSLATAVAAADTEWVWIFLDESRPAPDALERLLWAASESRRIGIVGPLLLEPGRRGHAQLIDDCGQTVTPSGRLISMAEGGEPDQGQLDRAAVLGVDLTGALVRTAVWRSLNGISEGVPASLGGVEFGWRANLAGHRAIAEPTARVVRVQPESGGDAERRRWELSLISAHASGSGWVWTQLRLFVGALVATLCFLLGKDPHRARTEIAGLAGWLTKRSDVKKLRAAVRDLSPSATEVNRIATLRPLRRDLALGVVDSAATRVADWFATFTERGHDTTLDELTGDDFAGQGRSERRLSPVLVGGLLVSILALIAGRTLFGSGYLAGAEFLPGQTGWGALLADYLSGTAGQPDLAAPPWLGLSALGSLVTLGNPDLFLTAAFLLCVPVSWFAAFRLLRRVVTDGRTALVGGLLYALSPALVGGLNRGMLGLAFWAALLPMLCYTALTWLTDKRGHWREAAASALLLLLLTSVVPLSWPLALPGLITLAVLRPGSRRLAQSALIAVAPGLLLLGTTAETWLHFPGRLLTGTSPALAELAAPDSWQLALGLTPGGGTPPLWLAGCVFGVLWLVAIIGSVRRPGAPGVWLAFAVGSFAIAVVLTRFVVLVPPGVEVRPQAAPWLVLMVAGLVMAGCLGLDGLADELRSRSLGGQHLLTLGMVAVVVATTVASAAWWGWQGQTGVGRTQLAALPPFVRVSMVSDTPTRTLAVERLGGEVHWALLSDALPRLGADERGLAIAGDSAQNRLAQSVANRLLTGSADNEIVADLARLGVGHVWLQGSDHELRTSISNVPGLGTGTGDDASAVWPVPNSARAVILGTSTAVPVGNGAVVPAGLPGRRLVLAEPADGRWWATVDGAALTGLTLPDGRQAFDVGPGAGVLRFGLSEGSPWWAWTQFAGLVLLLVMSAPGIRTLPSTAPAAPRRFERTAS